MSMTVSKEQLELWAEGNAKIKALTQSEYLPLLLEAYETLDTAALFRSRTHGRGHIERTMLLGALIAHGEALPADITRLLLLCCSYHDVGRINDWVDNQHGQRSADKILSGPLQMKFSRFSALDFSIALAAISAHSISDMQLEPMMNLYSIPAGLRPRCRLLAHRLKDADNLDRVRIHDLDPRHLRCPTAIALADDAQWIFDNYPHRV